MATEITPGFFQLDQNGETVTLDNPFIVSGSPNADDVTARNIQAFSVFLLGSGADRLDLESFSLGQFDAVGTSIALSPTTTSSDTFSSDGDTDDIIIGPSILPKGEDGGEISRSVILTAFGAEDRLTFEGVSASDVEVLLDQEIPSFIDPGQFGGQAPDLGTLQTGTTILVNDTTFVNVFNTSTEPAFTDEADFNDRVTFTEGGAASFTERQDLDSILDTFRASGSLPDESVDGVFELPTGPGDGDTVINIPSIIVEIGGESVRFDPEEPFFFDNLPAKTREAILADPKLAVGYDYRISEPADGQAFATVMAPPVGGDTAYNLIVFDEAGTAQPARTIAADETIDFEADYNFDVTHFIIEGITPDADLMPDDGRAFPTSISFAQDGDVDLQQTPLVKDIDAANVFLAGSRGLTVADSIQVFGRSGGDERVYLTSDATNVSADANLERVDIASSFSALDFAVTDDGLTISRGGTTLITLPSLNGSLELRASDGDASISQIGAQAFKIDGGAGGSTTLQAGSDAEVDIQLGEQTAETPPAGSGPAANVFLTADSTLSLRESASVFGRSGGDEGIVLGDGASDVRLDANVERLELSANRGDLSFEATDDGIAVTADGARAFTIPSLNQPLALTAADGDATIAQSGPQSFDITTPDAGDISVTPNDGPAVLGVAETSALTSGQGDDGMLG